MKGQTPVWQRVVCGLLSSAGAVALVSNALHGGFSGAWATVVWFLGAGGVLIFASVALRKNPEYREVEDLPHPSTRIEQLVAAQFRTEALKAYREEAGASLFEARAVIAHYWPNGSSERTGGKASPAA